MPRLPPTFLVTIDRLVFGGEGLGHVTFPNKPKATPIFVFGALPGERLTVRPVKVNAGHVIAEIVEIHEQSPLRRAPRDTHFLSCSPWQIAPEVEQLKFKKETTLAMWQHTAKALPIETSIALTPSPAAWGYRNKLDWSFTTDAAGKLQLAFHARYRWSKLVPAEAGCALAPDTMNDVARVIVAELNARGVTVADVKDLLVRYSFTEQKVIAALFVTRRDFPRISPTHAALKALAIIYSDPVRSQTVTTDILFQTAPLELTETIGGVSLTYGYESFFQINPPAFERLLASVRAHMPTGSRLVDLYSGVGTLGLALASQFQKLVSVELNAEAVAFARRNAAAAGIAADIISGFTERQPIAEICRGADAVIVDPPRAGLDPRVITQLLEALPTMLVYVSCNPATQCRDWQLLRAKYDTTHFELVDLYPQTPHVESVLVMRRRV